MAEKRYSTLSVILTGTCFFLVLSAMVATMLMFVWNGVLPELFGVPQISISQAVFLFWLSQFINGWFFGRYLAAVKKVSDEI